MFFDKPIQMPRGSHYGSNYWEVFSKKMNRKACFFSTLEFENFLTLEMNPRVKFMCEQPLQVEILLDGRLTRTIFDVWVKYIDDTEEMQEVKYSDSLEGTTEESIRTKEQIRKQKVWCEENNIQHAIRTEKDIHVGECTIENHAFMASRIRRYSPPINVDSYINFLIGYLKACKAADIKSLINSGMLPLGNELNFLCYMHYMGVIKIMIDDRPIDYKSEVTLYGK